jgi:hypothetical protein
MYHTFVNTLSAGPLVLGDIPALQDDIITIQNNHWIPQVKMNLFADLVISPTITEAQLISPTKRQINPVDIRGLNQAALSVNNPFVFYLPQGGMTLTPFEELQFLATITPGTTERVFGIHFAGDVQTPWPAGDVYPVKFTSATATVANVWTTIPYGVTNVLPSGVYTMVLSELSSATAVAHRWIFSGQYLRPGMPSAPNTFSRLPDVIQQGWLGTMGAFRSTDLPRLQVLCTAADAAHTGFAWLIRTGNLI